MSVSTTLPVGADARGEQPREIAGAAGEIEHARAGAHAATLDGEALPQPVQAGRHQVVHQVVACRATESNTPRTRRVFSSGATCS